MYAVVMIIAAIVAAAAKVAQTQAEKRQAETEEAFAEYRMKVAEQAGELKKREAKDEALQRMAAARMHKGISSSSGSLLSEELTGIKELGYTLDLIDWETSVERAGAEKEKKKWGSYSTTPGYMSAAGSLLGGLAQAYGGYRYMSGSMSGSQSTSMMTTGQNSGGFIRG